MHATLQMTPLGEVILPVKNWNPQRAEGGSTIRYIDIGSISQEQKAILPIEPIEAATAPSRARQLVAENDVLVSTVRPNLNAVARVPPQLEGATASTGFCVLRPEPRRLDPGYLFHWVRSPAFIAEMVRNATGQSYPAISDRIVKESLIPLPPLPEQKRIAAILDQADALRRLRQQAIDRLNGLGQAIFRAMFGNLIANDAGWPTQKIEEVCEAAVDCVNRTAPAVDCVTPFRMIRTTNVRHGRINLQNVKYVNKDVFERWNRRLTPRPSDVILTREAPVGEVGILKEGEVFLGQRLFLYRAEERLITPEFLLYQFRDPFLQNQMNQLGMGSTVKHLPLPACLNFQVRVPPIDLQNSFSDQVRHAEMVESKLRHEGICLEDLFASLQSRAFSGEL